MGVPVELDSVTKRYPANGSVSVAVDRVSLAIPPGQAVAVMGPSGSGKSTLLHLLGAMERADEGTVRVGGQEITRLSRRAQATYRRSIGFVFQRFHLLPVLTALDNVAAPVLPYRTPFDKFARAHTLLRAVGLGGKEASLPSRLSGGEQQRVAIARALINAPGLLLADEPTGNLDSETSTEIMQLLLDLQAERQMTIVVATHDPMVATRCQRIIRLQDGRVTEDFPLVGSEGGEDSEDAFHRITGLGPGA